MKALKIAALVAGALVVLAILAGLVLSLSVDPNRFRPAIEAKVQQATGRRFTIAGAIHLKFFPWIALDVGRVAIGNPPGFGNDPLLAAEHLEFGARLLPLLRGRLEVSRVALDGLTVNLIRRADGATNWADNGAHGAASSAASPGRSTEASVAGFDVSRASFSLRDDEAKSLLRVRDVEVHAGSLGERVAD